MARKKDEEKKGKENHKDNYWQLHTRRIYWHRWCADTENNSRQR